MSAKSRSQFLAGVVGSALWLMTMAGRPAAAEVIHVPDDYPTIQQAIDAAAEEGDEIIVAPDTYNEAIDFLGKAIWLHSSGGPEVTTIDGEGLNTSVVTCASGEGPETILEGFTITGGDDDSGSGMLNSESSPTVVRCGFTLNGESGMSNWDCPGVTVRDSTFSANEADGIWSMLSNMTVTGCTFNGNGQRGMNATGGNVTLADCLFEANAWQGAQYTGYPLNAGRDCVFTAIGCLFTEHQAGGMSVWSLDFSLVLGCTFIDNTAEGGGAGIVIDASDHAIVGCDFIGNVATYPEHASSGGGIMNCGSGHSTILNCTFADNSADRGGAVFDAGWIPTHTTTIANCLFVGNEADRGGAVYGRDSGHTILTNCTITQNTGLTAGALYNTDSKNMDVRNSIVWGNGDPQIFSDGLSLNVAYSDVQGGWEGEGNIDADPLFVDPESGDYRLSSGSPCIDAADNTAVPPDELDLDEDGDTEEPIPFDLDFNPRFVDDPDTEDTGYGEPPIVDMGAYEYQAGTCPADFDGDGDVDTADLLHLLGAWGTPDGDVDGDGDTDTADLLALLGVWGECP